MTVSINRIKILVSNHILYQRNKSRALYIVKILNNWIFTLKSYDKPYCFSISEITSNYQCEDYNELVSSIPRYAGRYLT